MAVKPLAADSKLVVYNNEVDLADKGVSQVYQGATIADVVAASGAGGATLVTDVPTFDATKIGEKVYYNGEEWIYASQEWLEALGLDSLVSPGYALPVNFVGNPRRVTNWASGNLCHWNYSSPAFGNHAISIKATNQGTAGLVTENITWDFRHIDPFGPQAQDPVNGYPFGGNRYSISVFGYLDGSGNPINPFAIERFEGVELLHWLQDAGTAVAFDVSSYASPSTPLVCSSATIDDFFTRLPATTKTATLDVTGFTGGAGANAAIAQAKGYTVIQ